MRRKILSLRKIFTFVKRFLDQKERFLNRGKNSQTWEDYSINKKIHKCGKVP